VLWVIFSVARVACVVPAIISMNYFAFFIAFLR
jgi:hypothetical protein